MAHQGSADAMTFDDGYGTTTGSSGHNDDLRMEIPSRACDACRKMKIRCIDKENPPCKRCRHMKLQCRFAMAPVPRVVLEEQEATKSRLELLEGHVTGIFEKLDEMSNVLFRLARPRPAPGTPSTTEGQLDTVSPRTAMSAASVSGYVRDSQSIGVLTTPGDQLPPPQRPLSAPSVQDRPRLRDYPAPMSVISAHSVHSVPPAIASSTGSIGTPWSRPDDMGVPLHEPVPSHIHATVMPSLMPNPAAEAVAAATGVGAFDGHRPNGFPSHIVRSMSPSTMSEDDALESAMEGEPFRHFTQREEELHFMDQGFHLGIAAKKREGSKTSRDTKRRRTEGPDGVAHDVEWIPSPIREKGDPIRDSSDPISMGYLSVDEGQRLFQAFFKYAHPFVPVFDPREDTWESLRRRSPFCIAVILLVALRQREATGPPSELSRCIQEQVERMAKITLFSPLATLETVQGLAVLISYSEHAWRTCCHAMALAVDMRLYRCLPYLHKIKCDARQPHHMLERQRPLVVGARLWLALVRLAYEISYNHALPILFPSQGGKRTQYARELLDHPLSTLYDTRLVISTEMCEIREPAFRPYESVASLDQVEMDETLRRANQGIHELYEYWYDYYESKGVPREHFLRIELDNQKSYAIMFGNSLAWYGVQTKDDVKRLSPDRQLWVTAAMRSAAFLVSSVANKRLEKDSEFGNHNFHVGIVATARYLIRMCELLPDASDLFTISLDIDRLLIKLPYYPVRPFADGLRRTVARAREQGILPYTRMSEQASRAPVPSPPSAPEVVAEAVNQFPGFNPFPWNDPVQTINSLAPGPGGMLATASVPDSNNIGSLLVPGLWTDEFNLAAWFPQNDDSAAAGNLDISALDVDMANWFPAAPQVWHQQG